MYGLKDYLDFNTTFFNGNKTSYVFLGGVYRTCCSIIFIISTIEDIVEYDISTP